MEITPIAVIHTDLPEKFGIPRQAGLAPDLKGRIVFQPPFRDPSAVRGLDGYDYLWLVWGFDGKAVWSPTVRPPRLGGQKRMGVFATRSPNRPNRIGLSSVRILSLEEHTPVGPVITVGGADLRDGTLIYDIKPYIPFADAHPGARGGFTDEQQWHTVRVDFPRELLERIEEDRRAGAVQVLEQDPRAAYEKEPGRIYGLRYGTWDIRFLAEQGVLRVVDVVPAGAGKCK